MTDRPAYQAFGNLQPGQTGLFRVVTDDPASMSYEERIAETASLFLKYHRTRRRRRGHPASESFRRAQVRDQTGRWVIVDLPVWDPSDG